MKKILRIFLMVGLLPFVHSSESFGQCASNIGFESGSFANWSTSTDSLFIQPANRVYFKPGINTKVVSYGVTDLLLGAITKPHVSCGNYLTRVGNRSLRAVADTVYRKYIVDSLSDKLTIYCKGVSEQAHNYWGVPTIEAPGFGYEIYVNGRKLDCLKGSFFCGNTDTPAVWQLGDYKDTAGVRKSTAWAKEVLNFACYVGDTIEVRLFTRDCILLGHYAYAYFDVVCGDTTKPVINQIMFNDIIEDDELTLYCQTSTTLYLEPNTEYCPIFRSNVAWTPASYVSGASNLDSVRLLNLDSVWIYATASFSNYCQTVNVRDSILVKVLSSDPHDNIPIMPTNFCDCKKDTIDFGTTTITSVSDEAGNTLILNNGILEIQPCDNFYEETFWKLPSAKIVTNASRIGTLGWVVGNVEGAVGHDSILATGQVRYVIDYKASKSFYAGITTNNTNNNNDIDHAIFYNGGNIRAYYNGSNLANLGTYTGTVTVDFITLSNRRVQIWINGTLRHSYTNAQRATFPVFPDFSARCNDTNQIKKTYIYGPTKNIKDFTRLLIPTTYSYYLTYTDRCGLIVHDTVNVHPGFAADVTTNDDEVCGYTPITLNVTSANSVIDLIVTNSNGNGTFNISNGVTPGSISVVTYTPDSSDFANNPIIVYLTSQSGRCFQNDTGSFIFHEEPRSNAGPDISTSLDTFQVGGSPAGHCATCGSFNFDWNQGYALSDSTTGNPFAYENKLTTNSLILKVTDPSTGCFSRDTMFIYTSLSNDGMQLHGKCLAGNMLQFTWSVIPSVDDHKFGIEFSTDFGRTWISAAEMLAGQAVENGQAVGYSMTINKIMQDNVLYRWYAINKLGVKKSEELADDINCGPGTIYNIHPNPFTSKIEITIEGGASLLKSNYTIQIYNQYGQLIVEKEINPKHQSSSEQLYIDGLEDFNKGIYYVQIRNNFNTLYSTTILKIE